MKAPKESERILQSSFLVSGKPKVQMNELCTHLQSAPFLRQSRVTEPKTFSIIESDGSSTSELQITGNKLAFNYQFHRSSTKEYTRNLLKFLSILAYLDGLYEPELSSLYPSMMEVLVGCMEEMPYADGRIENSDLLTRQAKTLSAMNCSLSLQILRIQDRCRHLELGNSLLSRFSRDAIDGAMARAGARDPNAESLPRIIGTTAETYRAARALIFGKKVTD